MILNYLIHQSKMPSGLMGRMMMAIWNKSYLPMVKWSLNFVRTTQVQQILDVGVGNGKSTAYLSSVFPGAEIHGLDISPTAIQEAKNLEVAGQLDFTVSAIEQTDFSAESFDLVCGFQTHFHWDDLVAGLNEIHRLLKEQGQLLLACEQSKLDYFLPQMKTTEDFQSFIQPLGFQLLASHQKGPWIAYSCQKI